jgi:hypothetical protein
MPACCSAQTLRGGTSRTCIFMWGLNYLFMRGRQVLGVLGVYSRSSTVNKGVGASKALEILAKKPFFAGFKCCCATLAAQRQPHGLARTLAGQQLPRLSLASSAAQAWAYAAQSSANTARARLRGAARRRGTLAVYAPQAARLCRSARTS